MFFERFKNFLLEVNNIFLFSNFFLKIIGMQYQVVLKFIHELMYINGDVVLIC
jgi:hypothetical protein